MAHTELGRKILDRLVGDLKDTAQVEAYPKLDGRNMVMVIAPTRKHAAAHVSETSAAKAAPPVATA